MAKINQTSRLHKELDKIKKEGNYKENKVKFVPKKGAGLGKEPNFGQTALAFPAAILFIDMRGSTEIMSKYKNKTLARINKIFLMVISEIVTMNGGEIRSFDGDSVLAFFCGVKRTVSNNAILSALQIKYALRFEPKIQKAFAGLMNKKTSNQTNAAYYYYTKKSEIDFGIGITYSSNIWCIKSGSRGADHIHDLVWLDDQVNKAAHCSKDMDNTKFNVKISNSIFTSLNQNNKKAFTINSSQNLEEKGNIWVENYDNNTAFSNAKSSKASKFYTLSIDCFKPLDNGEIMEIKSQEEVKVKDVKNKVRNHTKQSTKVKKNLNAKKTKKV
jgi:adenylate cyclase